VRLEPTRVEGQCEGERLQRRGGYGALTTPDAARAAASAEELFGS
jgi:hypothetical protein